MLTLNMFRDLQAFGGDETTGIFKPNVVVYDRDQSIAAILIKQSRGGDFALSEAALNYVAESEEAGKIGAGYIILQDSSGAQMIASAKASSIYNVRSNMRRSEGKFGPYWWINKNFEDATKLAEKAPF